MDTTSGLQALHVRAGQPDFLDLPWALPLASWPGVTTRLVQMSRGVARHEVVFVSYRQGVYALKELPPHVAEREYERLGVLEERGLPAVQRVGVARARRDTADAPEESAVLITRFLDASLPYRALFRQPGLERYRERLLDAIASLLVRLHLAGFYWGDCSLSNTLFRRDAGELQAFLVDAETSEVHDELSDGQREMDLGIMEENVSGELADVAAEMNLPRPLDVSATGVDIRRRYSRLWNEITREVVIRPGERYKIHERIRALNDLGFSVSEVELVAAGEANHLRMRAIVTDRDYHRHQLHSLTGVVASERQANLMLQEIRELQATLARERPTSVPLSVAALEWLEQRWQPVTGRLAALVSPSNDLPELYCQVLEHKWFMSERAGRDVGLETALEDYLARARTEAIAELPPTE
ncbi:MAG: DUF4032 domain-containing protein [Candidatus Eisenbacteria bacterium]